MDCPGYPLNLYVSSLAFYENRSGIPNAAVLVMELVCRVSPGDVAEPMAKSGHYTCTSNKPESDQIQHLQAERIATSFASSYAQVNATSATSIGCLLRVNTIEGLNAPMWLN